MHLQFLQFALLAVSVGDCLIGFSAGGAMMQSHYISIEKTITLTNISVVRIVVASAR